MLIFKKNIYEPPTGHPEEDLDRPRLDPYNFLFQALMTDRKIFISLTRMDETKSSEQCRIFFPHASRFGSVETLNALSKRLIEGLVQPDTWYRMNAYHLCYLYDSLYGTVEEYSYEPPEQRVEIFPELHGHPIDFDRFLEEYFINTAFLIDPDRFNNLDSDKKKNLGSDDPCLFGVINKLLPTEEEIRLKEEPKNPYL